MSVLVVVLHWLVAALGFCCSVVLVTLTAATVVVAVGELAEGDYISVLLRVPFCLVLLILTVPGLILTLRMAGMLL